MRFRTKLFLAWALSVLLPLAAIAWPLTLALRDSFERAAQAGFAGTRQSLAGVQAARVAQMRQAGTLVMNIPQLRALIADNAGELSNEDQASLRERLDYLASQIDVSFICVLNARSEPLAQNTQSPWASLDDFTAYASRAAQPQAMVRRLFAPHKAALTGAALSEEGLWVHHGKLFEVVGIPLIFDSDATDALPSGALFVAVPLSDAIAGQLADSHNCQISFLADGRVLASSLPPPRRAALETSAAAGHWPMEAPFTMTLDHENFRASLKPLIDQSSGTQVGAMLIQTSTAAAEATEWRILSGLTLLVLLAITGALVASYLLSGIIVRPVRLLVEGARDVAGGNLETVLPVRRGDELGQLTVAFNDMVAGLRRQKELQTLVEESQAATRAKSRFLANMSHEIRTPLHGIIGMSELLLRTDMSNRQQRYVGLLKSSAELLTKLINDVLDFSKAEAGKLELEAVDFDLKQLAEDAMELMAQRAHSKRLGLLTEIAPSVPTQVRGDPTRLRQILLNLLSNALKFTDAGSVTLRVTCAPAGDAALYKFEVQDTGMGIPRDRMNRLFQSFSQVDASTTRRFGGTGLGLAICKQLAELMGGQIGVESVEGNGSTFWVTARMQTASTQAPAMPGKVCRLPVFSGKGLRVLLVEDQEINCIVASELLTEADITHDIVHDGKAAVDAVVNGNYQLILMDCQMPGMDGMEATRRIRAFEREHPARARVPIIALTANTSGADRDECVASGMDGFCSKPFTTHQLYDAIATALGDQPPALHHEETKERSATKAELPGVASSATFPPPRQIENQESEIENVPPPFDLKAVMDRCSNKSALAATILDKFQNQTTHAFARIQALLAEGNAAELARVSHAVKGTAGLVGAASLRNAAARLEELGRAQSLGDAKDALDAMRAEVDRCVDHIRAARAHLTANPAAPGAA